jgi:hypothetical protein
LRGGTVWPRVRLTPGERLTVTVKVRRPSWVSWLVGGQEKRTMTVVTPAAHIRSTLLRPKRGTPVTVSFAEPVSRVAIGGGRLQNWKPPGASASRRPRRRARYYGSDDGCGRGSVLGDALEARPRRVVRSRRPEERRRRARGR